MAAAAYGSSTTLDNPAGIRFAKVTLTPATSYSTGGVAVTPATFGFASTLIHVFPSVSAAGVDWQYVASAAKVLARRNAAISVAGSAAAASTDALSVKSGVLNKESVGADTVLAQAGTAEVSSTVDLSADLVTFFAIGY